MEITWITEKVVDDRGVVTHIDWTLRAWEGVSSIDKTGREKLPDPDPELLQQFMSRNPDDGRYVFKRNEDDAAGFLSADRIERDTLHPWLFAIIDKAAIELELTNQVRDLQSAVADVGRPRTEPSKQTGNSLVRTVTFRARQLELRPEDALALFGALALAVDGQTARVTLASGETLELTHQDVSDIGRQLAGKPADEVPGQDRGARSPG